MILQKPIKSLTIIVVALGLLNGCSLLKPRVVSRTDTPASTIIQSESYAKLAAAYIQIGRLDIAKLEAQKALAANPNSALANNIYGLILMNIGESDQAENYLTNAIALEPDNPNYQNNLALFYCRNNRAVEGMRLLNIALSNPLYAKPQNSLINAGICAESLRQPNDAEKYYRKALIYPNYRLAAQERLANLYYKNNRPQDAYRELYSFFSQLDPPTPQQYQLAIMISRAAGKTKEADTFQQRLNADYPDVVKSLEPISNSQNSRTNDLFSSLVNQNQPGNQAIQQQLPTNQPNNYIQQQPQYQQYQQPQYQQPQIQPKYFH